MCHAIVYQCGYMRFLRLSKATTRQEAFNIKAGSLIVFLKQDTSCICRLSKNWSSYSLALVLRESPFRLTVLNDISGPWNADLFVRDSLIIFKLKSTLSDKLKCKRLGIYYLCES